MVPHKLAAVNVAAIVAVIVAVIIDALYGSA
jgi:hypothetical protein